MNPHSLQVTVNELSQGHRVIEETAASADFELEDELYRFPEPVRVEIEFQLIGDEVFGRGRVATVVETECVRCLKTTRVEIDVLVDALWESEGAYQKRLAEMGEDADDGQSWRFDGETVDPREVIREFIMSSLPDLAYCRDDCKGLCPQCGANRNEGPCACPAANEDNLPEWKQRLKGLKDDVEQ